MKRILRTLFFSDFDIVTNKYIWEYEYPYLSVSTGRHIKSLVSLKKHKDVVYLLEYDKIMEKIIKEYKFKRIKSLATFLADITRKEVYRYIQMHDIQKIVSIPISDKRLKQRGFNQIDEYVKALNLKIVKAKRVKNTKFMSELNIEQRKQNIQNSFIVEENLDNLNILIIDDIVTTGATVYEMRKEIKEKYNANVHILCICAATTFFKGD